MAKGTKQAVTPEKLKIGQLAQRSGVTVSTIKYYLREGLIPPPVKGSGAMSFYGRDHVDRITLIKKMQKEQYLPLSVIKASLTMEPPKAGPMPVEVKEMLAWEPPVFNEQISLEEMAAQTGYPVEKLHRLLENGYLHPIQTIKGFRFYRIDGEIAALFKRREDAGLSLEHTLQVFEIYRRHLTRAIQEDVLLCLRKVIQNLEGADFLVYVTEGEKTVTSFLNLFKLQQTYYQVDRILKKQESIPVHIVEALNFRSLESIARELRLQGKTVEAAAPLEFILKAGLLGDKPVRSKTSKSGVWKQDIPLLVNGIFDIVEGRNDEALTTFNQVEKNGPLAVVADALSALAHMIRVSQFSSMLHFIKEMRKALDRFQQSRRKTGQGLAELFSAYCRLVGFAVRPHFFNGERDADQEMNRILTGTQQLMVSQTIPALVHPFLQELVQKSRYFLVFMHLEGDRLGEAESVLESILAGPEEVFYSPWARKKKAEITSSR